MKLISSNKFICLFIFFLIFISPLQSEEEVDLWEKTKTKTIDAINDNNSTNSSNEIIKKNNDEILNQTIEITDKFEDQDTDKPLYGLFDPEKNNLSLNMWSKTDGNEIKDIFKRVNDIKLSKSAEDLFINVIMTYAYSPKKNISDNEFLSLKINWLIENKKDELLEQFLNKNINFKNKEKVIQYLVDSNIAKANLNSGCKKAEFISKEIKDAYLEKFKIYCLIFKNKKNEAQLVFDILKEQGLSDKFFDNKINFLLGINDKPDNKIKDNNLLNFYLSSITVPNFNYEPTEKTNKYIWEYINAANLVQIDDLGDKEKIRTLEVAANNNTLNKEKIFEIYKKLDFDLNTLINAEGTYQSFDSIDSRALIFQKFLLSDNTENKIKLLFLLKDLFKKDNLSNIFAQFLSDRLKELDQNKIPENYKQVVEKNIISEEEYKLGKIKFDDKILHRSKVIRYYVEEDKLIKKSQKDFNSIYKKIKKNKNYFYSAKDLALVESLELDGFLIPKEIKHTELAKQYSVPEGLLNLVKNDELGLLSLKFVEIIGEDEIYNLDPETIYFITHILNKAKLIKFRNKVLTTALPLRA
tara:strand:- start:1318 stop:3063 length:1746 start_codon:yes stop_codon:yes gene_type:complete